MSNGFRYTERPLTDFEMYKKEEPTPSVPGPTPVETAAIALGATRGIETALSKIDERRNKRLTDARLLGEKVDPNLTFQYQPTAGGEMVTENIFQAKPSGKGRWRSYLTGQDERLMVNPKYTEGGMLADGTMRTPAGTLTDATKYGLQTGVDPSIIRGATGYGPDPSLNKFWNRSVAKRTTPSLARPSKTAIYKPVDIKNPYTGKAIKPRTNLVELPKSNIGVKYQAPTSKWQPTARKGLGGRPGSGILTPGGFGSKFNTGEGLLAGIGKGGDRFMGKFATGGKGKIGQVAKNIFGPKGIGKGGLKTLWSGMGGIGGLAKMTGVGLLVSLLGSKLFKKHTLLGKIFSDKRLKKNIKYVGKSISGTPIVEFDYIEEIGIPGRYRGVLSKDVPHAREVHPKFGFDMVDYSKTDVEFSRIG